jgi:hypothetical protein
METQSDPTSDLMQPQRLLAATSAPMSEREELQWSLERSERRDAPAAVTERNAGTSSPRGHSSATAPHTD